MDLGQSGDLGGHLDRGVCRHPYRAAVVLCAPLGPAQELAAALGADGWQLRAHRSIVEGAAAYRRAGVPVPAMARFAVKLATGEVLLWPVGERDAGSLRRLGDAGVAWVAGGAADAEAVAALQVDAAIPYAPQADFEGLLAYVAATGAREVAVKNGRWVMTHLPAKPRPARRRPSTTSRRRVARHRDGATPK